MANSSTPFGFLPYRHDAGSPADMGLERVWIDSSNAHLMFTGDLVVRSSGGNRIDISDAGSTSDKLWAGVFAGCKYYSAAVGRTIWSSYYPGSVGSNAANGVTEAYVISDPEMRFIGAAASSVPLATADMGYAVTIVTSMSSLGNTATGRSVMTISTALAAVGAGSSYPWVIVDFLSNLAVSGTPGTDNTTAGGGYNQVILAPNDWNRRVGQITWASS